MILNFFILLSAHANDFSESLCGKDNRQFSYDQKVARVVESLDKYTGCSATMIGTDCAISAGHCIKILNFLEFNIPHPRTGELGSHAAPEDTYTINKSSIVFLDKGMGKDWAVFKVNPNAITGKLAGEVYGSYEISYKKPRRREMLSITGHGMVRNDRETSGLQRVAKGKLKGFSILFKNSFTYKVDTEPGNSGSAVISEKTGKIVGIHTNGGCSETGGENRGTIIAKNKDLIKAIKSCLSK